MNQVSDRQAGFRSGRKGNGEGQEKNLGCVQLHTLGRHPMV